MEISTWDGRSREDGGDNAVGLGRSKKGFPRMVVVTMAIFHM